MSEERMRWYHWALWPGFWLVAVLVNYQMERRYARTRGERKE